MHAGARPTCKASDQNQVFDSSVSANSQRPNPLILF